MNKSYKVLLMAFGMFALAHSAYAEVYHIGSARAFDNEIAEHKHAAVLFYDIRCHSESLRKFKKNSSMEFFQDADLHFYAVDTSERRQLADLADEFDINLSQPAIVLYRNGVPVTNAKGYVVVLTSIDSSGDIETFIDNYLGNHLENTVRRKRRHERVYVVERVYCEPKPRVNFGIGLGPVVGYAPYCPPCVYECRPRIGFGFNIGL